MVASVFGVRHYYEQVYKLICGARPAPSRSLSTARRTRRVAYYISVSLLLTSFSFEGKYGIFYFFLLKIISTPIAHILFILHLLYII